MIFFGPRHAKTCLRAFAESVGPDQPAHGYINLNILDTGHLVSLFLWLDHTFLSSKAYFERFEFYHTSTVFLILSSIGHMQAQIHLSWG